MGEGTKEKNYKGKFWITVLVSSIVTTSVLVMAPLFFVSKTDSFNSHLDIKKDGIKLLLIVIFSVAISIFYIVASTFADKLKQRPEDTKEGVFSMDRVQPLIEKQFNDNVAESKDIAERLFSRSNTCLVVGCVISILGVFVFYLLNSGTEYNSLDISQQLFTLLPRFGILFFIEYVAFFFLKQYRILMEEYRYYEAIKRDRQNLLSIYYLVDKYKDEKEILELMNNYIDKHSAEIPKYSGDNRVKMEKSLNEDMDVISKITKLVQVIKTPDKSKE